MCGSARRNRPVPPTRKNKTELEILYDAAPRQRIPDPQDDEGLGAGEPGRADPVAEAGAGAGSRRSTVRVDAIAVCATDIEILRHGVPALVDGELPFNRRFTPGHEYMGTVVRLGPTVDEFEIGDRIAVEVHAGCGRCQRCREGMYTSCLNYGDRSKGHRANGFSTDGGFAEYAVNNINTMVRIPDGMTDAEATLMSSLHLCSCFVHQV